MADGRKRRDPRATTSARERRASAKRPAARGAARKRGAGSFRAEELGGRARARLKRFRQGSLVAVAVTALLLIAFGEAQEPAGEELAPGQESAPPDEPRVVPDAGQALEEATGLLHDMVLSFFGVLPKIGIAAGLILLAWLVARGLRFASSRALGGRQRGEAVRVLLQMLCFAVAIAASFGIVAGDARALLGSLGLFGLALSWALQTPIESFTGWLLNSFRSYYRVGDRIEVGDVFGDVYKIDVLTTTVWEAGGPGKAVAGAQSTGAMITFPNWEVLRSNVVNYSRDFPFVWDEVTFAVAESTDLAYAIGVLERAAHAVVGGPMAEAVAAYRGLLERARLAFDVDDVPRVFLAVQEGWIDCTVRYLVDARARRRWSTRLIVELQAELARPEHAGRIASGYPRQDVRLVEPPPLTADPR